MSNHSVDERALWNQKFAEGSHTSKAPDPFLVSAYDEYLEPLQGNRTHRTALDFAGGTGRHALYLAERGWDVTLLDISDVGLAKAKEEADKRRLSIRFLNEDASAVHLHDSSFDLITVFFFLDRAVLPMIFGALKPGGILVYKTYTRDHPRLSGGRGPNHPMHLLEENELLRVIREQPISIRVLYYRETVSKKGVAELVGMRERS